MQKPESCQNCTLFHRSDGFSFPDGAGTSGVVIVGDYLAMEDYLSGKPLTPTTQAGAKLEQVFRLTGTSRSQFKLWNVLGCKPPYGGIAQNWSEAAGECAKQHGRKIVGEFVPGGGKTRTILGLGSEVLTQYTQYSGLASEKQDIEQLRGYVLESVWGPYVPTYDAKWVSRGMNHYTPAMEVDLDKALRVARGEWKPWTEKKQKKYITTPSIDEARAYVRFLREREGLVVSADIETRDSDTQEDERDTSVSTEITLIQFSHKKDFGIAFPWRAPFVDMALEILRMPHVKVGHNWYGYDGVVLRDKAIQVNGRIHDTMWMFKHWHPKLSRGLQPAASFVDFAFPWKHYYGSRLEWYGCADVDATWWLWDGLPEKMKRVGVWEGYLSHVFDVWPILEIASRDNGIPVNVEKKRKLEKKLELKIEELNYQIQLAIPDEIKSLMPRRKIGDHVEFGYKTMPKQVKQVLMKLKAECERRGVTEMDKEKVSQYVQKKTGMVLREQTILDKKTGKTTVEDVWCKLQEFKASKQQLTRYINHMREKLMTVEPKLAKLYEVPTATKKGVTKETTGKEELKELAESTGDDVLMLILESRSINKLKTNDLPNWEPGPDGRVHSQFNFGPPQGQFASRAPNVQNCFGGNSEILTEKGWQRFDMLERGVKVAQYLVDGSIEFVLPEEYIEQEWNKPLLKIYTEQQINMEVTSNHDCVVQNRRTQVLSKVRAADYPADAKQPIAGLHKSGNLSLSEAQIGLLCAIQADGSFVTAPRLVNRGLWFSFRKKRKKDRLEWILTQLGIPFKRKDNETAERSGYTSYYVSPKHLPSWVTPQRKFFSRWILRLDRTSLDLFCKEVFMWDGCIDRQSMYASSVKSNADLVQAAIILSGKRARLRRYVNAGGSVSWQVDVSVNSYAMTTNHVKEYTKQIHEKVYCVRVPSGMIVTRFENEVAISGNCSKHTDVGQMFREIIECPPGYVFLEFDYKSFHVATMGYVADDPTYILFSQVDPHSIFASSVIDEVETVDFKRMTVEQIKAICKQVKKEYPVVRQKVAKPTVLGNQLGLGPMRLWRQNKKYITGLNHAKNLQRAIAVMFPKVERAKQEIKDLAHRQTWLVNEFGRIQHFYEVYKNVFNRAKACWVKQQGTDADKAIAFRVQSTAFGMITEKMLELEREGMNRRYGFQNTIHDSLQFMVRERLVDEAVRDISRVMEAPCRQLVNSATGSKGLVVGVEASVGKNWQKWDGEKNKDGMREIC